MDPWNFDIEEMLDYMESPEFLKLNERFMAAGYLEDEGIDNEPFTSSQAVEFLALDTRPILH